MRGDMLSDLEQDALSTAIQAALSHIQVQLAQYCGTAGAAVHLQRLQHRGRIVLDDGGYLLDQARALRVTEHNAMGIAALAMLPGGVRVAGIVFCAKHYPQGRESRTRYSCAGCDPIAFTGDRLTGRHDMRDVITQEGQRYL